MLSKFKSRWAIAIEFVSFMAGKRLWLVPLLLGLLALTLFVFWAQSTYIAPFIYTFF